MDFVYSQKRRDSDEKYIVGYVGGKIVGTIEKNWNGYYVDAVDVDSIERRDHFTRYIRVANDLPTFQSGKNALENWYKEHKHIVDAALFGRRKENPVQYLPSADIGFYPTPYALAGKMFAKVDWKLVNTVLEPSAGAGNIVDCMLSFWDKSNRRYNHGDPLEYIDVIEIDENLQKILIGKGYHLVYDDFLTFSNYKHYDLIIMNPPFADGDKHLLKAIQMQERGGQIVCLLNAETIRNPYTNSRHLLMEKLAAYNAKIEFISDGFKNAQRKTDVEIAMISVNIPVAKRNSVIWDRLKKAQEYQAQRDYSTNALMSGNKLEAMVESYNMEVKAGIEIIEEYVALDSVLCEHLDKYDNHPISLSVGKENVHISCVSEAINKYLELCRLKYWKALLSSDELFSRMTSAMQTEYNERIRDLAAYEFDRFNIERFILEITGQLQEGVIDSIHHLFEKLTQEHSWWPECQKNIHYYNGWATNKAWKIGKKVILPINGFSSWSYSKNELQTYEVCKEIDDLERAMNYLDKGETVCHCDSAYAVNEANRFGTNKVEFTWFTATFYKKGTCHIKFNEAAQKIIDRLNIMEGREKGWLPPTYGKVSYDDMDDKSKAVIDEFQGKDEYEKVFANPSSYILEASNVGYAMLPGAI